ncbi:MAG: hypothetical protein V4691_09700 [Pseudomonadota bacterium]
MTFLKTTAATIAFLALIVSPALATKDVSSPTVTKGKLKVEARFGSEDDNLVSRDDRFRQVYIFEYGVTDWWATRLNFKLTQLPSTGLEYQATEWENKFQLFFEKTDGFNGAFKVVYSSVDITGSPDIFSLKTMAEKKFGAIKVRGNLGLDWEVGTFSGKTATLNAAAQVLAPVTENLSAGIEWFADFGEINAIPGFDLQDQQLGPVFVYKFNDTYAIETGYLFGISDRASDGTFKLFLKATL